MNRRRNLSLLKRSREDTQKEKEEEAKQGAHHQPVTALEREKELKSKKNPEQLKVKMSLWKYQSWRQ